MIQFKTVETVSSGNSTVEPRVERETLQENDYWANRLGLWSSLLCAVLVTATTIATVVGLVGPFDTTIVQYSLWLVLAPALVLMIQSIHNRSLSSGKRVLSGSAVAFALVYAVVISINYYVQLSAVRLGSISGPVAGIGLFSLSVSNLHTVAWSLEVLSYGFQAVALLFLVPLFSGDRIMTTIRWLLIINGVNGVVGLVIFPLDLNPLVFVSSFFIWSILFPVMSAFIALQFRRMRTSI